MFIVNLGDMIFSFIPKVEVGSNHQNLQYARYCYVQEKAERSNGDSEDLKTGES